MKWVSDSYVLTGEDGTVPVSNTQKKDYLTCIAEDHEDWQVGPADAAYDRA